jgi:F-type H+-transporting ATPase subunit gamma
MSMNNSGEIKARMKSIRQTTQIANAQKLIAASRIGKAQHSLNDTRPYHDHIRKTIAELLVLHPEVLSPYIGSETWNTPTKPLFLVLTSDSGLAGGYNSNIIRFAEQELNQQPKNRLLVQGNVGRTALAKRDFKIDTEIDLPSHLPTLSHAGEIAKYVISLFENREIDGFGVIYTYYRSAARLIPVYEKLLPLPADSFADAGIVRSDVVFEPSPEAVMEMLIPKYLKGFIYGCLLHSWASELTSRVAAMDSAIRNGNEILNKLSLAYNRARQAAITQEITEIVAGAQALTTDD